MGGFNQVFNGSTIYPSDCTYLPLTMASSVELAWPIEQQLGGDIVADIIDVDATAPGLFIDIPDAQYVSTGYTALFNNVGSQTVTVRDYDGGTIISIVPGTCWQIYLRDNSTAAGLWRVFQYGASVSVAVASALAGAGLKAITTTLNFALQVVDSSTTPSTLITTDRAKFINWAGGVGVVNLPDAAVVGNDWNVILRNSGSGNWTITPPSGTIDASATKVLAPGQSCLIVTDGANYFTMSGGGSSSSGSFNFTSINVAGAGDYTLSGVELNQIGYSFTGVLTGTRNIIVPGTTQEYWVSNDTTGAFSLFVKTAAQSPGVEVLQNNKKILYSDGTNVVAAESASISFPIPVAQGGTGAINAASARTSLGVPPDTRAVNTGTGLTGGGNLTADRTVSLSFLGIEALSDPNADRIMFWDDSAGAMAWLAASTGLLLSGTSLEVDRVNLNTSLTVGFVDIPVNTQGNDYTLVLTDRGKLIFHNSATPHQYTIPLNASVPFPLGTIINLVNGNGGGLITITTAGTLRLAGTTATGSRGLAGDGVASLLKIGTDTWYVSGVGIT